MSCPDEVFGKDKVARVTSILRTPANNTIWGLVSAAGLQLHGADRRRVDEVHGAVGAGD